jgi:succinate-semialdehyde dehydrogenase/glutarate-semialdehyde dehydrogenase
MDLKDPTLLRRQCLVGGAWVGTPETDVSDPASGAVIGKVPRFGAAETRTAIEKAHSAFAGWARLTGKQRSAILRAWFDLIVANREDVALIMTTEQGKPLAEALGEVDYAASFVEFNAEEAKRVYGETSLSHRPDARIVNIKQPIGVVGAITPWNFPAAMITRRPRW